MQMKRKPQRTAGLLLLAAVTLCAGDRRVSLLPKLQPGQTLIYLIRFQSDKTVKTESKVVAPMAPNAAQIDAHGLLLVEVLDVQPAGAKAMIHARGQFLTLDSGVWLKKPGDRESGWDRQHVDPHGKSIEFTISPDGSVNEVKGLDFLFPEQQQAWQQWVARFALAWTLPANGMKFGEKWKLEQAEQIGAPISGLNWARESMYVRDEPCQASQLSIMGDLSASSGPPDAGRTAGDPCHEIQAAQQLSAARRPTRGDRRALSRPGSRREAASAPWRNRVGQDLHHGETH